MSEKMYSDELSRRIEAAKDAVEGYRLLFAVILTPLLIALSSVHSFRQDGSDFARWSLTIGVAALFIALCGLAVELAGELSYHANLKMIGGGKSKEDQTKMQDLLDSKPGGAAFTFWSFVLASPAGYVALGLAYFSLLWGWGA